MENIVAAPKKIKINRILVKAETRKAFSGAEWEAMDLAALCEKICTKLGIYGEVDDEVRQQVEDQVRGKLIEKGRDPSAMVSAVPQIVEEQKEDENDYNLYGGGVVKMGDPTQAMFPPAPPPRVMSPQVAMATEQALAQAVAPEDEEESSSEEEDLYGMHMTNDTESRMGYDWTLEKLNSTIHGQLSAAPSWQTVIKSVRENDPSFESKISLELYTRILTANKPFSPEEIGKMALDTLDRMFLSLDRKRDPTQTYAAPASQPAPANDVMLYDGLEGANEDVFDVAAPAAPFSSYGGVSYVPMAQESSDSALVERLQRENQSLRTDLTDAQSQNQALRAEITKLREALEALEDSSQAMAAMLQKKQNELHTVRKGAAEQGPSENEESAALASERLAVAEQLREIHEFALRSQQQARASLQMQQMQELSRIQQRNSVSKQPSIINVGPAAQVLNSSAAAAAKPAAQPAVAAPQAVAAPGPVVSVPAPQVEGPKPIVNNTGNIAEIVESTIPQQLKEIHYINPQHTIPWQTTRSMSKTKRGTSKAIVSWTMIDDMDQKHIITLEHNHYTWNGKSKRKVLIDNEVKVAEKSDRNVFPFVIGADRVTVIITSGANGYAYDLHYNDWTFNEQRQYWEDVQRAIRASRVSEDK